MDSYKILNNRIYTEGIYSLVPIRMEDRFDIMRWRNEQIYHLRQPIPLTTEGQDNYFTNVVSKLFDQEQPDQILFSYLEGEKCIGYGGLVHINWIDKNAEISFIMDTRREKEEFNKHWSIYLGLIEKVAFKELKFHKLFTYAFDLRPHLYEVLEGSGYIKEAVLKEHCLFNDEFKDVVIHSIINDQLTLRKIQREDKNLIFEWANEEQTRFNSFNSNEIPYNNHSAWFDKKLIDKNACYYICEFNGEPTGLVRFDIKEDKLIIGITIDKRQRGKRLSSKFLSKACEIVTGQTQLPIIAYIKKENFPSIKSFEKAGFIYNTNIKINDIDAYEYKYKRK